MKDGIWFFLYVLIICVVFGYFVFFNEDYGRQQDLTYPVLIEKDGLYYESDSNVPYTGKVIDFPFSPKNTHLLGESLTQRTMEQGVFVPNSESSNINTRTTHKLGPNERRYQIKSGEVIELLDFDKEGTKRKHRTYESGLCKSTTWDEAGQKRKLWYSHKSSCGDSIIRYEWNASGTLVYRKQTVPEGQKFTYVEGNAYVIEEWYPSGQPKTRYNFGGYKKVGQDLGWEILEEAWYENGQKKYFRHFLQGSKGEMVRMLERQEWSEEGLKVRDSN